MIENYLCKLEFRIITKKEKLRLITNYSEVDDKYVISFLDYYFEETTNLKNEAVNSINNILYFSQYYSNNINIIRSYNNFLEAAPAPVIRCPIFIITVGFEIRITIRVIKDIIEIILFLLWL